MTTRTNIRARNMGIHGGEDMGAQLNAELRQLVHVYQRCNELQLKPSPWGTRNFWALENRKAALKYEIRTLCRIRRAGRLGREEWL